MKNLTDFRKTVETGLDPRLTTAVTGPHVTRNTQTTVKLVFKSLISVAGHLDEAAASSMLWAFRF